MEKRRLSVIAVYARRGKQILQVTIIAGARREQRYEILRKIFVDVRRGGTTPVKVIEMRHLNEGLRYNGSSRRGHQAVPPCRRSFSTSIA